MHFVTGKLYRRHHRVSRPMAYRPLLENPRHAEAVETDTGRVGSGVTDYHMIEQVDVEGLGRLPEVPGLCEATDYGNWTTAGLTRRA